MDEYEFKYEAPPISEIVKVKIVEGESIDIALERFWLETDNVTKIFGINLI